MIRMSPSSPPCALTIAGSDSGGGAGIQADLKTFAALGIHGLSAITALTAQNTRGVNAVHVPPVAFLRAQIDACFDDFAICAVKLGMLANADVIHAVADALTQHKPRWIVLDPVMVATSGASLLQPDAVAALRSRLLPIASIITPNIPEAEVLLGHPIHSPAQAEAALQELLALGAHAVLLKGGHLHDGNEVADRYIDQTARATFSHPRLNLNAHGSGCNLASAIAAYLCLDLTLLKSCEAATSHVHAALLDAYRPARSQVSLLNPFHRSSMHPSPLHGRVQRDAD